MGVFIDRPLGYGKETGEPDLTPLLAHEAFSPSIAPRRQQELQNLCAATRFAPMHRPIGRTLAAECSTRKWRNAHGPRLRLRMFARLLMIS